MSFDDVPIGKLFGLGEIKYRNGNTYDGHIKGNLRHGYGKMTYETAIKYNGEYDFGEYKGYWKRDKREGKIHNLTKALKRFPLGDGTMLYSNGCKFIGKWKNNMRQASS